MKTWQDQKIGTRLGVVFGAILLCVIAVGGFGLSWLGRLNSNMSASIQKRYNTVELTRQTIEHSITNARITFQLFETTDPEQEKKLNQQNDAISQEIGGQVAEIEKTLSSRQERELFEIVTQDRDAYKAARSKAKKLLLDKKRDEAMAALSGDVIPALDKYRATWQKFIDLQTAAMQQTMKESQQAYAVGRSIALLLLIATLILSHTGGHQRDEEHYQPHPAGRRARRAHRRGRSNPGDSGHQCIRDRPIAAGHARDEQPAVGHHSRRPRRFCGGCFGCPAGFRFLTESLAGNQ